MEDKVLQKLAERYGTPSYLFDADEVVRRAVDIKQIMNDGPENRSIGLCFSIKANPFLIPALKDVVDHFEVCSPGELSICMKYEVPGKKIIYSGVHKDEWDTGEALRYGCDVLTAESAGQYDLILKKAEELKIKAAVILRISSGSQFGMSVEDAESILKTYDKDGFTDIQGLHYFVGTQRLKLKHQKEELKKLKETVAELRRKYGLELSKLEYGPGLGYPYFEDDDRSDTLRPIRELAEDLKETAGWCQLTVEMGRFLASSCGYYMTKVVDKKTSGGRNWAIMDGGINHINYHGQMMGLKVPVIKILGKDPLREADKDVSSWALCGSLCTVNDVIVREYKTSVFEIGDVFVFLNAGAYSVTEAMGLFLSRDLPKVAVVHKDGSGEEIRDRLSTWKLNS
ncbi:MAG: diaminopimelate decarboxylase [Lachnospiraceae bacterium]|nr:diaminopimelate decarboxylase [Lachnospiraceae bacterium]